MTADPSFPPIHPGEILMLEYLEPLEVTQHRLAVSIGVPPRRINEIVHGKRRITTDTALRLARYFGTSERFWLNLQDRYDIEVERDARAGPGRDSTARSRLSDQPARPSASDPPPNRQAVPYGGPAGPGPAFQPGGHRFDPGWLRRRTICGALLGLRARACRRRHSGTWPCVVSRAANRRGRLVPSPPRSGSVGLDDRPSRRRAGTPLATVARTAAKSDEHYLFRRHQGLCGTPRQGSGIVSCSGTGSILTSFGNRGYSSPGTDGHSASSCESQVACAASTLVVGSPPAFGFEQVPWVVWISFGSLVGSPPPSSTLPCQQLVSTAGSGLATSPMSPFEGLPNPPLFENVLS